MDPPEDDELAAPTRLEEAFHFINATGWAVGFHDKGCCAECGYMAALHEATMAGKAAFMFHSRLATYKALHSGGLNSRRVNNCLRQTLAWQQLACFRCRSSPRHSGQSYVPTVPLCSLQNQMQVGYMHMCPLANLAPTQCTPHAVCGSHTCPQRQMGS